MATKRYPAALIFGVPGAGKGTQGEILTRIPGFFHVSSGAIFRKLDEKSADSKLAREYTSKGELVPDEVTLRIIRNWLDERLFAGKFRPNEQLLLLDGIPRNLKQCAMLDQFVDVRLVVHLECHDEEAMVQRIRRRALLEKRPDDANEQVIRRRFEVYREQTEPVLNYYNKEIIREVDSTLLPIEVLQSCLSFLAPVYKQILAS